MGIRGLTTVVRKHGSPETHKLLAGEGSGKVLLVDGGSLQYHVLAHLEHPSLTLAGGLHHSSVHALFTQWFEFYSIYLGLHVHVVLDGGTVTSLNGKGVATFMKRRVAARERCSWWARRWPHLPLHSLDQVRRAEVTPGSFSRATIEHAMVSVYRKGGSLSLDTAVEDADTAVRAYYETYAAEIFAVKTDDSDFFVW